MKRLISLILVAVMLVCAMPLAAVVAFAEEAGETGPKVISKYTDYSYNFTANYNEVYRNEAGMEKDAYAEAIAGSDWFSINQGIGPWKVGTIKLADGTFAPFTRTLFMINDGQNGDITNHHDVQWASTEEQYIKRLEVYMNLWDSDNNGAAPGLSLWDGQTPLYYYTENPKKGEPGAHNGMSGSGTELGAFVYTVEADGWVNFRIQDFVEQSASHGLGILLNGEMIWPNAGADLSRTPSYYRTAKDATTTDIINGALVSANGTEVKAGDQIAFVVQGTGMPVFFSPEIIEYEAGKTVVSRSDFYGTNNGIDEVEPGTEYTIPTYVGDLIFMGWDVDGDGVADYADGATFVVPNAPSIKLEAVVVAPSRFFDNYPTSTATEVTFYGSWTIGRYTPATDTYELFTKTNGAHIYATDAGMWGSTGGGFYVDAGKIAYSGCHAEGEYLNQIQYTVPYNGTISISFQKMIARREVDPNNTDANNVSMNYAIYKNGVKVWPTDADWYNYTSTDISSAAVRDDDVLAVLGKDYTIPVEVTMGDTLEFRSQQGNAQTWMGYWDPIVAYTQLNETPIVNSTGVTVGADTLGLDVYVQVTAPRENAVAGLLYWTAAQTTYDPATGTDMGAGVLSGSAYKFTYKGLAAKQMADSIYVMPYAKVEGNDEISYGMVSEVSIVKYAEVALEGNLTASLRAYIIALLNYGAEAQNFFGYNKTDLANSFLTEAEKDYAPNVSNPVDVYAQTGEGHKITSVSMICGNAVGLKFMTNGVEGATSYVLEVADNAEFTDAETVDMVNAAEGTEMKGIYYITNAEMAKTLYIRVVIDGTAGATLTYSVESYLNRISSTSDDSFYFLIASMVNLGRVTAQVNA